MSNEQNERSCAIVVTYRPDITALLKLLGQLNKETDFLVIDNCSPDIGRLAESIIVYERCQDLIRLDENEGLAKALNIGISWTIENNCDYVFLFDQDRVAFVTFADTSSVDKAIETNGALVTFDFESLTKELIFIKLYFEPMSE